MPKESTFVQLEFSRKGTFFSAVDSFVRSWELSKSLRAFAERLSTEAEREGIPEDQRQDIRAMAKWVIRHAEFVDPLTNFAWMIGQFKNPPWDYAS